MGRAPCCDKTKVKRGPWSPEEDNTLKNYVENYGTGGNWIALPHKAGLKRCGKSCRLRWLNYLRPNIKHGGFTEEEDNIILTLYQNIGSRWSVIASQLPGRTDNDVKNYWNTKLKKKLSAIITNSSSSTATATTTTGATTVNFAPSSSSSSSMETIYSRNSNFVPYFPLMEVSSYQETMPAADQIPLPELAEVPENVENSAGLLFPCPPLMSHEEALVSSFSPIDNKLEDTMSTFLAEFNSGLMPYDLLNYLTY